jgi:hypothetical protein
MLKNTCLSLLLFVVALLTVMLAGTQQSTTSASAIAAFRYGPNTVFRKSNPISAFPVPDPRNIHKGSRPRDKSVLWKIQLAMHLVQHPQLSQQQVQIILDAISLSTPEFFAASNPIAAKRTKADDALESLTRRAVSAFPKDQVVQLFANVNSAQAEEDILKMYYDMSALSLSKRKAAFRAAGPNQKSQLWRTHLALFFVKRELTDWQKQLVLSAMSLATPEYFRVRSSQPDWKTKVQEPSSRLEQQILNAFSLDDAARIFATLGDDGESAKNSASVLLKSINYKPLSDSGQYKQWAHSRVSRQDIEIEQSSCSCSTQSDYCPIWSACGGGNCNSTESGCGTLWSYPCNGACR